MAENMVPQLKEKITYLESEVARLTHNLNLLRRDKFGSKSEKITVFFIASPPPQSEMAKIPTRSW